MFNYEYNTFDDSRQNAMFTYAPINDPGQNSQQFAWETKPVSGTPAAFHMESSTFNAGQLDALSTSIPG